jgi:uncharacterized OsmC-like protein
MIYDAQLQLRPETDPGAPMDKKPELTDEERVAPYLIDPEKQKIIVRKVRGSNGGSARTHMYVRDFEPLIMDEPAASGGTDTGPTPFEMSLAALVGCEGVIIHGVAAGMRFAYDGVEFEAAGQFDLRGPRGVRGVRPFFEWVELTITLKTEEPPDRVARLAKNVENRCPVMNLMRDAGTDVRVDWKVA